MVTGAVVLLRHCAFIDVPLTPTELTAFATVLRHRASHLRRSNDELAEALIAAGGEQQ